jgi:hypothetical protein
MKNEASKTRSLKIAFVVNSDHLRRLDTVLSEASNQREYNVGFSDGTSVRYGDVEDVIKLPNSNEHSIISLIAGTPEEGNQTALVTLRKSDPESPTLEYTLGGPQRSVVYLGAQLDDWVAGIRQWYSFGRSSQSAGAIFAIFVLFGPLFVWDKVLQFLPATVKTLSWAKALALVLLYVAEFGIFKLFPHGTFAIGRGAERHQFLIWLRRAVAALLASTVAGAIIKLLIAK